MKVNGKIVPLKNRVLVSVMNFEGQRTQSGILIPSDNGKVNGIHPRWGKVWGVGPTQTDVKVGDWILIEHGRWTRSIECDENGVEIELRMVDNDCILMAADEPPNDVLLAYQNGAPAANPAPTN